MSVCDLHISGNIFVSQTKSSRSKGMNRLHIHSLWGRFSFALIQGDQYSPKSGIKNEEVYDNSILSLIFNYIQDRPKKIRHIIVYYQTWQSDTSIHDVKALDNICQRSMLRCSRCHEVVWGLCSLHTFWRDSRNPCGQKSRKVVRDGKRLTTRLSSSAHNSLHHINSTGILPFRTKSYTFTEIKGI